MCSILTWKAYHFDRDDVALQGFHKFMLKQSDEEREHAQKVIRTLSMVFFFSSL